MKKAILAVCLLGCSFGCTGDGGDVDQAQPTESADLATPAPTPCSLEDATTDEKREGDPDEFEIGLLSDVRPNADDCPRVVLEFENHVPSYRVRYVEPPIEDCGSGAASPVEEWDADAFIEVDVRPAASADIGTELRMTYDGPRDFDIDGPVLKHLKKTCDSEAVLVWVIALDSEHPFTVDTLENPARLVVDISGT